MKDRRFVFIVSYHKNGTRSLHTYLGTLGMKGIHWPVFATTGIDYEYILSPIASDPRQCMEALTPLFAEYDYFSDVPFPGLYRETAELFPNSRYILTRRAPQDWGESIWRHWRKWEPEQSAHKLSVFEAIQYHLPVDMEITESNRGILIDKYIAHNEAVENYFAGTDRLLTIDLNDQDISLLISKFLGFTGATAFPKIREGAV